MRRELIVPIMAVSLSLLLLGKPVNLAAVDFAAATSYPVGTLPAGIAVGDFNGDGKPDMAVANSTSGNVSILLGNGDGTFQAAVNYSAGNSPSRIAVGDFNGDGKLDLAVFQPSSTGVAPSVSILLGNGDGTFQAPKTMTLSQTASFMAVADFNVDNKSDLALGDSTSLDIYIGNGDGTFQPAKQTTLSSASFGFVTADFNGDSKPDMAIVTGAGIQILLGNGDGTFTQGATVTVARVLGSTSLEYGSVVAADLNHDGKVDLLVTSIQLIDCGRNPPCSTTDTNISAFLGNGDGSFQGQQIVASGVLTARAGDIPRGNKIAGPIVGDFNGDGKLDLAYRSIPGLSTLASFLVIRLGKGDGTFTSPVLDLAGPAVATQVAADLNANKLADLIALGTANDVDVLLNSSPSSGADLAILASGALPNPVGVGTTLSYTADILNEGPQDATGVTFTDTLPSNVSFVSATASQGSCVQSSGIVTCNVGALVSAFDFTVNIVVTPTAAGTLTNTMNVTATETDPNPANNTATQTTTVVPVFKIAVTKSGNGSGTITSTDGVINCGTTCSAAYLSGTLVNLVETPDANSVFTGWSGACTGSGNCAITMNSDLSVTANFVLGVNLSVVLAGSGSGSVTSKDGAINCANSGGTCSSVYAPGTSVSLTAVPAAPSVFTAWSGACTGTDPNACNLTMNSSQTVTATFNPPADFTLTPASTTFTTQTGGQVPDQLTLTGQNGFSGTVALTCMVTGPAPLATCGISPGSVAVGSNPGTSTLTMTAPLTLSASALPVSADMRTTVYAVILPLPVLLFSGIGLVSRRLKKRLRGYRLLGSSVILLFAVLAGCGGSSSQPPAPQTYAVTVNATSGTLHHATSVTLTVQ